MTEAVQIALIAACVPMVNSIVLHFLADRKIEKISANTNGALTKLVDRQAKLEDVIVAQLPPETNPKKEAK